VRQWQVADGLIYGQVKKCYRRGKLVCVRHVMRLGTEATLKASLQRLGFSGRLNTAFIERVNLTVRHGIAALARWTWATAQQSLHLFAHLEWWRTYYHFVRPHASLRVALAQPRERDGKLVAQRYRQNHPTMDGARSAVSSLIAGAMRPHGSMKDVRRRPVKEQEAVWGRGEQEQER